MKIGRERVLSTVGEDLREAVDSLLSPARLPVPPPSLIYIYCVCTTELIVSTLVSELQLTLSEKRLAPARFQQAVVCEAW